MSIGASVKRVEDMRFITGNGTYVGDVSLKGQLYLSFVRSKHPHARISSIDVGGALKRGAIYVMTGDEAASNISPLPFITRVRRLKVPKKYPLAVGKVLFVGEPIAAVVAEDLYKCYDAAEEVRVDYEPLRPILDVEEALREDALAIHEELGTNVAYSLVRRSGDLNSAFSSADIIVRARLVNQRVAAVAMEARAVLANYDHRSGMLQVWSSTQVPHILKTQIAKCLRFPENRVRVIAPDVGGGFGSKLNVYPEELVAAYLALKLRRPVKWVESRLENLTSTTHGRDQIQYIEAAARSDGKILGLRAKLIADIGSYHQLYTPLNVVQTALMLPGPYKIENIDVEALAVFTNKMPTDAYRGAGRPEATYAIERVVDMIAKKAGLDPAEVRYRNIIQPHEFPYRTSTGMTYDSGNYAEALRLALEISRYSEWKELRRSSNRLIGVGIGLAVEVCGHGPSKGSGSEIGGWESAVVRVDPSGKVSVITGVCPTGQGNETTFAQIVADKLGVAMDDVLVVYGDTKSVPHGVGTFGSRSAAVGGVAVSLACEKVVEKARQIAASLLEVSVEDVVFEAGKFYVREAPDKNVSLQQVASQAYAADKIDTDRIEPGLEATVFYDPEGLTFPFGAHVAVVEVDRDTGNVNLLYYACVDDCGRVINPMIVEGQIHGGIAQGIGQALYEEIVYSSDGQPLTSTLSEYLIPSALEIPEVRNERTETPSRNRLGVKGVGELSTLASTAAIANAIADALGEAGLGLTQMPFKPERIWLRLNELA